jgi:hypothetical protein
VKSLGDGVFDDCPSLNNVFFLGNAPDIPANTNQFLNDNHAKVYYLPDTTGWSSTFGGAPALLWNPHVADGDPTLGMQTNGFGFDITGTAGIPLVVEGSTNLNGGYWTALQSCSLTNGSVYFLDSQATNCPTRYYRFRSP